MSDPTIPVSITILDKEYTVSCPAEEKENLLASAKLLNDRMREVRDAGKVLGTERMAVMAALNLVHEMSQQQNEQETFRAALDRDLSRLERKVTDAVGRRTSGDPVD